MHGRPRGAGERRRGASGAGVDGAEALLEFGRLHAADGAIDEWGILRGAEAVAAALEAAACAPGFVPSRMADCFVVCEHKLGALPIHACLSYILLRFNYQLLIIYNILRRYFMHLAVVSGAL